MGFINQEAQLGPLLGGSTWLEHPQVTIGFNTKMLKCWMIKFPYPQPLGNLLASISIHTWQDDVPMIDPLPGRLLKPPITTWLLVGCLAGFLKWCPNAWCLLRLYPKKFPMKKTLNIIRCNWISWNMINISYVSLSSVKINPTTYQ